MFKIIFVFLTFLLSLNTFANGPFSGVEKISVQISKDLGYAVEEKDILQKIDSLADEIRKEGKSQKEIPDLIIRKIYSLPVNDTIKIDFPEEEGLLSFLVSTGRGNCYSYSTLFLALGERLGIDYSPVLIPGHIYLRYGNNNIETTVDGKNLSDKNIASLLHLNFKETKFNTASRDHFISGLYSNACIVAAYKGKLEKGLEYCDLAIKYNSNNGEAYLNKSFIEGVKGLLEESLENAKKGVALYPHLGHAYFILGNAHNKLKKTDEAMNALKKSIKLRPNIFRAHYNLGNIYLDQNKLTEAISYYNETIRLNPESRGAYVNRAIAYSMSKKYLQAIKDYNFLLKKEPYDFDLIFERGKSYYNLKKYQLALKDFELLQKKFSEKAKQEGINEIILEIKKIK